jgi:cytochrome c-type biogenesis protein CcmE
MDPARKRRIRLVVALTAALLLAGALAYTSFSASSSAVTPSQLISKGNSAGQSYQLTGKVVNGSIRHVGDGIDFRVRDRNGTASVPVSYTGTVPDPFKDGREVIVTVRRNGGTYVGEKDSLTTKCPSKFTDQSTASAASS